MKLFDAHCHLQDNRIFSMAGRILHRAGQAGVAGMMSCGTQLQDWDRVLSLADTYRSVIPSIGIHPWYVMERSPNWLEALETSIKTKKCGVGEIGLDYGMERYTIEDQRLVFIQQLRLARACHRPVTIHCRNAWSDLIEILHQEGGVPDGGIIHGYGGSPDTAVLLEQLGCYFSFGGAVTRTGYKKSKASCQAVSRERILIETDSPDMIPEGVDGDINEPSNLIHVLRAVALIRQLPVEELARITYENSIHVFGEIIESCGFQGLSS